MIAIEREPGAPVVGRLAWLRAGVAVAAVGWGANQFAPLLLVYRARLGLSEATVQATFGCYALGLIPSLLLAGSLADRFGRRRVMLPALVVSVLASVVLMLGADTPLLLFAGRLLAGLASGAAFSSGAAWIKELSAGGGARRVTVTMTAGFGAGPLVAGLAAQWLPAPAVLPYLPHVALLLVALALVAGVPDTRARGTGTAARVRAADLGHPRMRAVVLPLAPWVFGSAAVALAYLPGLVQHAVAGGGLWFTALVTSATALAGIAVQPAARRVGARGHAALAGTALATVTLGLLVAAAAAATVSPVLCVLAVLVLGAGYGACQVCGLQEVTRLARPDALAGLTAVYQAVSYLGFALPFLLAALAAAAAPGVLLAGVAVLAAVTSVATVAGARRTEPGS